MVITVGRAVRLVLKQIRPLGGDEVALSEAHGRILFENVWARRSVPPFDNSAMDGYAVRWQDVANASERQPARLRVVATVKAGRVAPHPVLKGVAIRIMTGAPIPRGADTIVRVEHTEAFNDSVYIKRTEGKASHVRRAGEDIRRGQTILERGRKLFPADIGLMASVGKNFVKVFRQPTVGLISTGDELMEIDDRPAPGKIFDSNSYTLSAAIKGAGAVPRFLGIARDNRRGLITALRRALRCDVVITSGGVSVGDYDFVKEVFRDIGVRVEFWKVAQRPGHPMAFGLIGQKPVFGLPGNPVSSAVSFLLYARPALLKMMGYRELFLPVAAAHLEHDIRTPLGLKEFIRCRVREDQSEMYVSSTGTQSSGVLRSLALADGLIVAQEKYALLKKGTKVPVILLRRCDQLQREMGF
jgi:molybdopterin molybdotransferase